MPLPRFKTLSKLCRLNCLAALVLNHINVWNTRPNSYILVGCSIIERNAPFDLFSFTALISTHVGSAYMQILDAGTERFGEC